MKQTINIECNIKVQLKWKHCTQPDNKYCYLILNSTWIIKRKGLREYELTKNYDYFGTFKRFAAAKMVVELIECG